MDVLENSAAEALEIGWKSTPNSMVPVVDDLRENMPKPSEKCDFYSFSVQHKRFVSLPNMVVREISLGDAPEIGLSFVTYVRGVAGFDGFAITCRI